VRDPVTLQHVSDWLGWPKGTPLHRLAALDDLGPPSIRIEPATDAETLDLLFKLDVPVHAMDEIVAHAPSPEHAEAWWLLERLYHALVAPDGQASAPPWPAPFPTDHPLTHHYHLYVFLAAVPHVLRMHAEREIPEDVTWWTLRDVGLQVANYEVRTGRPGFDGAFWVWPHFRGEAITVGRLQYDRRRVPDDATGGLASRGGAPALGVHIPALGPLTPEACDESLSRAPGFYAKHFPEERYEVGICESWLMDDQLLRYLPSTSNIARFQQRFALADGWSRLADDDVVRFAFGRLPDDLSELPQDTTLERALVAHLRDGGHWYFRRGWLEL
jgi:GNAT domain-containint protein/N-acyltransferase family protein